MSKTLSFTEPLLTRISKNSESYYNVFVKSVKSKDRTLAEPHPVLKTLQKRIISRIFSLVKFPQYLHGGIKTEDPRDFFSNANAHCKAETAITLDIKSFFPSITTAHVENIFQHLFSFNPDVSKVLALLTTVGGTLPQGAPTSSYIANLVMWEKEYKLVASFNNQKLTYTRLIDDMTISSLSRLSSERITSITTKIAGMLNHYDFNLHDGKKNVYSRSNPEKLMLVTGLWLNRGSPRLEKYRRVQISKEVIEIKKSVTHDVKRIFDLKYHKEHNSISGKVALLQRLGHSRALRLRQILDEIQPKFDVEEISKIEKLIINFGKKKLSDDSFGYLKKFYRFQHTISIVKRTDSMRAKKMQIILNKKRPKKTLKELHD